MQFQMVTKITMRTSTASKIRSVVQKALKRVINDRTQVDDHDEGRGVEGGVGHVTRYQTLRAPGHRREHETEREETRELEGLGVRQRKENRATTTPSTTAVRRVTPCVPSAIARNKTPRKSHSSKIGAISTVAMPITTKPVP